MVSLLKNMAYERDQREREWERLKDVHTKRKHYLEFILICTDLILFQCNKTSFHSQAGMREIDTEEVDTSFASGVVKGFEKAANESFVNGQVAGHLWCRIFFSPPSKLVQKKKKRGHKNMQIKTTQCNTIVGYLDSQKADMRARFIVRVCNLHMTQSSPNE
ncbi:hypothetical protein RFI_33114 [Reticulomyxa filosa]|uniref:Uncharacterized protein n=1 Tax=Reticulomyxa filosa TaxID=46433 RepID=X6LT43_RETFI|nr:hypothetical protein RFI_33114 [Reticulomyxa filosa]|eukprot:ETO04282.1 hypothetical protein RFI_33114 [Reticulomyxa filosa]